MQRHITANWRHGQEQGRMSTSSIHGTLYATDPMDSCWGWSKYIFYDIDVRSAWRSKLYPQESTYALWGLLELTVCRNIKKSLMNKIKLVAMTYIKVIAPFLTKHCSVKTYNIAVKNSTKRRWRLIHQLDSVSVQTDDSYWKLTQSSWRVKKKTVWRE